MFVGVSPPWYFVEMRYMQCLECNSSGILGFFFQGRIPMRKSHKPLRVHHILNGKELLDAVSDGRRLPLEYNATFSVRFTFSLLRLSRVFFSFLFRRFWLCHKGIMKMSSETPDMERCLGKKVSVRLLRNFSVWCCVLK